jgi:hypothetical protein
VDFQRGGPGLKPGLNEDRSELRSAGTQSVQIHFWLSTWLEHRRSLRRECFTAIDLGKQKNGPAASRPR